MSLLAPEIASSLSRGRVEPWILSHSTALSPPPPGARTFPRCGGRCERVSPPLGHLRRPPQRPALCLWEVGKTPAASGSQVDGVFPRGMRTLCETEWKEFHSVKLGGRSGENSPGRPLTGRQPGWAGSRLCSRAAWFQFSPVNQ